jgi:hypothetical protein
LYVENEMINNLLLNQKVSSDKAQTDVVHGILRQAEIQQTWVSFYEYLRSVVG